MGGQAVSDLEKSLAAACTGVNVDLAGAPARPAVARASRAPGSGEQSGRAQAAVVPPAAPRLVLSQRQEDRRRVKCRCVGFRYPHLAQRAGTTPARRVEGHSPPGAASSLTAAGQADALTPLFAWEWRRLEMHAHLSSGEARWVARGELPARSTGSPVPLNRCVPSKGSHLNNAKR